MTVLQQNPAEARTESVERAMSAAAVKQAAHADVAKWEAERTRAEAGLAAAHRALASADVVDLAAAGILADGVQAAERDVVTATALEDAAHQRLDAVLAVAALDSAGALRAIADAAWATYLEHAQRSSDLLTVLAELEGTTFAPGRYEGTPVTDQLYAAAVAADTAAADAAVPLVGGYAAVRPGPVTGGTRAVVLIVCGPVPSMDNTDGDPRSTGGGAVTCNVTVDGVLHDRLPYLQSMTLYRVHPVLIEVPVDAVVALTSTRSTVAVSDTFDPSALADTVDED